MKTRSFSTSDTPTLVGLFRDTVRRVCQKDYSHEQIMAWAPDDIDVERWKQRMGSCFTVIVENESTALGFASLESDGNLDMLYVHADWQGKGVAKLLYASTEGTQLSRQAITKHLRVMKVAGLVRESRRGRESIWELDKKRLEIAQNYLARISRRWDEALGRLRDLVET